jgi:hypothetical protein
MFAQQDHISQSLSILVGDSETPRQRLLRAGSEFWQAMRFQEQWPPDLWDEASQSFSPLLENGTVQRTVGEMDDALVNEITAGLQKQLALLSARMERAIADGWGQEQPAY